VRSRGEDEPAMETNDKGVRDYIKQENRKLKDEIMRVNLSVD
jgi:hypothetical protein